jgi:8-oxo-dGTP diphosphatase
MPSVPDGQWLPRISARPGMTTVVVAAAVIERDGRLLVTRRQQGTHLEGYWEFPGGKCHPGETHEACLAREVREELGASATVGAEILSVTHPYPDRTVELHFFWCDLTSVPIPQMGQEMQWVAREQLVSLTLPPADSELVNLLTRNER